MVLFHLSVRCHLMILWRPWIWDGIRYDSLQKICTHYWAVPLSLLCQLYNYVNLVTILSYLLVCYYYTSIKMIKLIWFLRICITICVMMALVLCVMTVTFPLPLPNTMIRLFHIFFPLPNTLLLPLRYFYIFSPLSYTMISYYCTSSQHYDFMLLSILKHYDFMLFFLLLTL